MLTRTEKKAAKEKKVREPIKVGRIIWLIIAAMVTIPLLVGMIAFIVSFVNLPYAVMQENTNEFYLAPAFNGLFFPEWLFSWGWIVGVVVSFIFFIIGIFSADDNGHPHPERVGLIVMALPAFLTFFLLTTSMLIMNANSLHEGQKTEAILSLSGVSGVNLHPSEQAFTEGRIIDIESTNEKLPSGLYVESTQGWVTTFVMLPDGKLYNKEAE